MEMNKNIGLPHRGVRMRQHRRRDGGWALVAVLVMTGAVMVMMVALGNLSATSLRLTSNGRDKAISLSLAEAGVDDGVDQLRMARLANPDATWAGTSGAVTLTEGSGNVTGTYTVQTVPISKNLVDIYSDGTTTNGKKRQVRARVNMSGMTVMDGAILSNGDVEISGSVIVKTSPFGRGNADIRANRNIMGNGSAAMVDGRVAAVGTVNLGGVTSTDDNYPRGQSGAPRIPFPDAYTIAAWKNQWYTQARSTNMILPGFSGSSGNGSLPSSYEDGYRIYRTASGSKVTLTISGPAYINGNISLSGNDKLVLRGSGPIYVSGNVNMGGNSVLTNSVNLIVGGTFKQVGSTVQEPIYEAGSSPIPPCLISLSTDPTEAIKLSGNATNNDFSVIYAVHGGITCTGSVEVRGALVAGGIGCTVEVQGNYTHTYPKDAIQNAEIAIVPTVISWIEF
jgi:Tfp pilus assembly protein PilX